MRSNCVFFRYYQDLPPVAKTYGVLCLMTSGIYHLGLIDIWKIALSYEDVLKRFQVRCYFNDEFDVSPVQFLNLLWSC